MGLEDMSWRPSFLTCYLFDVGNLKSRLYSFLSLMIVKPNSQRCAVDRRGDIYVRTLMTVCMSVVVMVLCSAALFIPELNCASTENSIPDILVNVCLLNE